MTGVMAVPKGMQVPSSVNAPFYLLGTRGIRPGRVQLFVRQDAGDHQTVSRISATQSAGRFTFRRGRIQRLRGRHSVLIMTTIYLDLETIGTDDASVVSVKPPATSRRRKASPNGEAEEKP